MRKQKSDENDPNPSLVDTLVVYWKKKGVTEEDLCSCSNENIEWT